MAQALETAISEIVAILREVEGIRNVPINPPESMPYETFIVVYPFSGTIDIAPIGDRKALHQIAVDVLTKRTDLAKNFLTLKPLIDLVSHALISEVSDGGTIFNNSINTFSSLSYNWTASEYAGVPVVGYHFIMIDTKILVNL